MAHPLSLHNNLSSLLLSSCNSHQAIKCKKKLLPRRDLISTTGLGLISVRPNPAKAETGSPPSPIELASTRLSYSKFLEYLDEGKVRKVDLIENERSAVVEIYDIALEKVQRVKVELPGLPRELLRKLRDRNVDFSVSPPEGNLGILILDLLSNLAFPLMFLGLLLFRTSNRSNGPGGPTLPFGLGRSKAKFQMEPNTGVTFNDIAGVDEAKQEFQEILKVHSSNKRLDKDVSHSVIAMRTPGFSGADLANLLNEAAILAGRRGLDRITTKEIDDSIDRVVAGIEGTTMIDGKSKLLVAYHEIGHALCATLTDGHDPVQKVTLIPRGQARGLTWFIPNEDPTLVSKKQLFARIIGGLGGRAAEEVIFGEPEITTGAAGDLQQVTQIAKQMVTKFGMSEIGPWALIDPATQQSDLVFRMLARNSMWEKLAEDIDASVRRIIETAYEIAKQYIRNNREAIDDLWTRFLKKKHSLEMSLGLFCPSLSIFLLVIRVQLLYAS